MPGRPPDQKGASPTPPDFDAIKKLYEAKKFYQALEQINLHLAKPHPDIIVAILHGQKGICLENQEHGDHAATAYQHFINFFLKNSNCISEDINELLCNAIYHNAEINYSQKQYEQVAKDLDVYFKEINVLHNHKNTPAALLRLVECCHINGNGQHALLFIGRYLALGFQQETPFVNVITTLADEKDVPAEHSEKLTSNRTNAAKVGVIIDVLFKCGTDEHAKNLFQFFISCNIKDPKYDDVCLNIGESYRNILIEFLGNSEDPTSVQLFKKWQQALTEAVCPVRLKAGIATVNTDYFSSPTLTSVNEKDPLNEFVLVDAKNTLPTQSKDLSSTNSSIRDSAHTDMRASASIAVSMVASGISKTASAAKTNNGPKTMSTNSSPSNSATAMKSSGLSSFFRPVTLTYRYQNSNVFSPQAMATIRRMAAAQNQQVPLDTGTGVAVVTTTTADASYGNTAGKTPPPLKL